MTLPRKSLVLLLTIILLTGGLGLRLAAGAQEAARGQQNPCLQDINGNGVGDVPDVLTTAVTCVVLDGDGYARASPGGPRE